MNMRQRKNKRKLLMVCTLLMTLCFVTGCGLLRSDEDKLKDLLEDKYGEEFGVESYYYAGDMWAMCYPVSDPTLLFEVRTDGEVTKISRDIYLQTVVARQVEEEYGPLVEQVFPGSYLSVTLSATDYEGQTADKVSLESMLQYKNSSKDDEDIAWTHITMNIFLDEVQLSEDNMAIEYVFLRDIVGNSVANDELPDTIIELYFGDAEFVQECKQVIEEETWSGNSEIYNRIKGSSHIRIYFYDGKPMSGPENNDEGEYKFEDYVQERKDVK